MRRRIYPIPNKLGQGENEKFLTVNEAAEYLRTTVSGIYSLVHRRKIPAHKPCGRLLFKKSELEICVESSRKGGFYGN